MMKQTKNRKWTWRKQKHNKVNDKMSVDEFNNGEINPSEDKTDEGDYKKWKWLRNFIFMPSHREMGKPMIFVTLIKPLNCLL